MAAKVPSIFRCACSFRRCWHHSLAITKRSSAVHPRTKVTPIGPFLMKAVRYSADTIAIDKDSFKVSVDSQRHSHGSSSTTGEQAADTILEETPDTVSIEVEDFGYIEDEVEEVLELDIDLVPERTVPVSLERGMLGVFDVGEIVAVLEDENGVDIQVLDIAPEARFVDHMVVVSAKSLRHMRAMAASIEWLYKRKKKSGDRQFRLEGRDCKDWFAMDLGNVAVHIFMPEAREHYDLETLWTLGPEQDNPRHYVQDDGLNLSAADLFWLEKAGEEDSSPKT